MSLFGGRKDGEGDEPAEVPPAPPEAAPPGAATRSFFGRGEEGMANIGKSITIKGDLTGNEDIVVEGTVEGKVELPNNQLTVGANGTAKAEITAKTIVVIGKVSGNVNGPSDGSRSGSRCLVQQSAAGETRCQSQGAGCLGAGRVRDRQRIPRSGWQPIGGHRCLVVRRSSWTANW